MIWADRLFLIELKTERRSHRAGQLPYYLELARHHHPDMAIDLLYVTPTMTVAAPEPLPDRTRYAWIPWTEVATLARDVWGSTTTWESGVVARLSWWVEQCEQGAPLPVRDGQPVLAPTIAPRPAEAKAYEKDRTEHDPDPLLVARAVQLDGKQRVLEVDVSDPEELEDLRLEVRDRLLAGPTVEGTRITSVRPWIWSRATTDGQPLSAAGAETGYELRFSRYRSSQVVGD